MDVVFRADASSTIGHGHVMRCFALAWALRNVGADCVFVSQPAEGDLRGQLGRAGFETIPVSGLSPQATADALRTAGLRPDWLVVDHYELDRNWESALRPDVHKILAIDDQPRLHDCDVFLNQNPIETAGATPPVETAFIGVEYALLQPEYRELRKEARPRAGAVRRVLITFGGADRFGMTLAALRATLAGTGSDVFIDVVIASSNPDRAEIESIAAVSSRARVHVDLRSLVLLMLAADLGLGAAGSTSWERMCCGLPSIVITLAANQEPIASALERLGLAKWVGGVEAAATALPAAIAAVVNKGLDEDWSRRCFAYVDGKGAPRVAAFLTASALTPLRARLADAGDEARVLRWANDPVTRRESFSPQQITPAEHHQWFERVLRDTATRQFIVETNSGGEVGQVRFHKHEGEWEVHYAVAPEFRGRKLGRHVLRTALDQFQYEHRGRVIGRVKSGNPASQKIFQALGFNLDHADADTLTYVRTQ